MNLTMDPRTPEAIKVSGNIGPEHQPNGGQAEPHEVEAGPTAPRQEESARPNPGVTSEGANLLELQSRQADEKTVACYSPKLRILLGSW